ncbi:hypothetical protein RQP46_008792 [Phenoliferia psychrophenolica]
MATLTSLASELLAHILKLSTEGETAKEQQRARLSFGLVSRASFLATANATDIYVSGSKQAEALIPKLVQEQKWVAQEERKASIGRTTRASTLRIMRISNVRRLRVSLIDDAIIKYLCTLLYFLSESLSAVELEIDIYHGQWCHEEKDKEVAAWYKPLEAALGSVTGLRRLHLVRLGEGLLTLELIVRHTNYFDNLLPLIPNLYHFCWTPIRHPLDEEGRDAVLKLLGAMTSLESLVLPLWTLGDYNEYENKHLLGKIDHIGQKPEGDEWDLKPVDRSVFDVLATLPLLHTVELIAHIGALDESDVISFVNALPSLRTLLIVAKRKRGWSREAIESVRAAAEEAGVAFWYKADHGIH